MANIHKTLLQTMLKSYGVTGARLDYHETDHGIYLTYCAKGKVRQIPIPNGYPLTAGELIDLLFDGARPAAAGAPQPATSLSG